MLNLAIPMAGRGQRFVGAYKEPKPLIRFNGKTMVEHVMDSVRPKQDHRFILVVLEEQLTRFWETLQHFDCQFVMVPEVTAGAACTVLAAKRYIDNSDPLLIVNSDQIFDWDVDDFLAHASRAEGCIATFPSSSTKYSYVRTSNGRVDEVAEKRVISNQATAGAYYWSRGSDYVASANRMIAANERTNDEFYVAPTYNYFGGRVTTYPAHINPVGTPEDLEKYLSV